MAKYVACQGSLVAIQISISCPHRMLHSTAAQLVYNMSALTSGPVFVGCVYGIGLGTWVHHKGMAHGVQDLEQGLKQA